MNVGVVLLTLLYSSEAAEECSADYKITEHVAYREVGHQRATLSLIYKNVLFNQKLPFSNSCSVNAFKRTQLTRGHPVTRRVAVRGAARRQSASRGRKFK